MSLLLLTPPHSEDLPKLLYIHSEAEVIKGTGSLIQERDIVKSVGSVLQQIPRAIIVHFACHDGRQINADPQQSDFELSDGRLVFTIDHLIHSDIPNGQFTCLSACESAAADENQ
jgi:CHAT domain-containing protein